MFLKLGDFDRLECQPKWKHCLHRIQQSRGHVFGKKLKLCFPQFSAFGGSQTGDVLQRGLSRRRTRLRIDSLRLHLLARELLVARLLKWSRSTRTRFTRAAVEIRLKLAGAALAINS